MTDAYAGDAWEPAMAALDAEIAREAAAPPTIRQHLGGTPLGDEIAPWVDELAAHVATQANAVALLRAMKPRFVDVVATVANGMLHVSGHTLPPDDGAIASLGPGFATAPAVPDAGALIQCLGGVDKLTTADIQFCTDPALLNVHGKLFALIPYSFTSIVTVTGRNVHQNLLVFVAGRYADFQSRQAPGANALALTLDGTAVPLAAYGAFDVMVPAPAAGTAVLRAVTAAGDATARTVP